MKKNARRIASLRGSTPFSLFSSLEINIFFRIQTKERYQNFAQQQSHIYSSIPNRAKSGLVEAFKHPCCSSSETTVTQPEAFDPQFISNREDQVVWQQNDPNNLMHACLQMIFPSGEPHDTWPCCQKLVLLSRSKERMNEA